MANFIPTAYNSQMATHLNFNVHCQVAILNQVLLAVVNNFIKRSLFLITGTFKWIKGPTWENLKSHPLAAFSLNSRLYITYAMTSSVLWDWGSSYTFYIKSKEVYSHGSVRKRNKKKPEQVNGDYFPLLKKGTKSDKKNLNTE